MKIEIDLRLLKHSAKKSFLGLRTGVKIAVSKRFFAHIAKRPRRRQDLGGLAERFLIVPFVDEILETGKVVRVREKDGGKFFRISKKFDGAIFTVIVLKTVKNQHFLVSCFVDWERKK